MPPDATPSSESQSSVALSSDALPSADQVVVARARLWRAGLRRAWGEAVAAGVAFVGVVLAVHLLLRPLVFALAAEQTALGMALGVLLIGPVLLMSAAAMALPFFAISRGINAWREGWGRGLLRAIRDVEELLLADGELDRAWAEGGRWRSRALVWLLAQSVGALTDSDGRIRSVAPSPQLGPRAARLADALRRVQELESAARRSGGRLGASLEVGSGRELPRYTRRAGKRALAVLALGVGASMAPPELVESAPLLWIVGGTIVFVGLLAGIRLTFAAGLWATAVVIARRGALALQRAARDELLRALGAVGEADRDELLALLDLDDAGLDRHLSFVHRCRRLPLRIVGERERVRVQAGSW